MRKTRIEERDEALSAARAADGADLGSKSPSVLLKELNRVLDELHTTQAVLQEQREAAATLRSERDFEHHRYRELADSMSEHARLRQVVGAIPCALVMAEESGVITFVNSHAEKLFGYEPKELIGHSIDSLLPERYRANHGAMRAKFLAEPCPARPMGAGRHLCCLRKDGSECPVEVALTQMETPGGKMVLAAIVDVTQRRELEQELEDRNREISKTQALAVVGRMANMVAHDLRNPLSSIKMGLQILGKQPAQHWGEEEQELKQIALEQVTYMERILADLLSYSRESPIRPEWLDRDKLLDTAILIAQRPIEERKARVATHYQPGLPTLHGDADKLRQVFSNLLINAVQATESIRDRRPEIRISTYLELGPDRPRIRVEIRDNGCGLESGQEDKLFEPFYTTRAKGTGLGLAIVRRIIEQHHGLVHLKSAGKHGACASVILPTGPLPELHSPPMGDETDERDRPPESSHHGPEP